MCGTSHKCGNVVTLVWKRHTSSPLRVIISLRISTWFSLARGWEDRKDSKGETIGWTVEESLQRWEGKGQSLWIHFWVRTPGGYFSQDGPMFHIFRKWDFLSSQPSEEKGWGISSVLKMFALHPWGSELKLPDPWESRSDSTDKDANNHSTPTTVVVWIRQSPIGSRISIRGP